MKPDWDDAPDWANYFGWDYHGSFYVEVEPKFAGNWWVVSDNGGFEMVDTTKCHERGVGLERRP